MSCSSNFGDFALPYTLSPGETLPEAAGGDYTGVVIEGETPFTLPDIGLGNLPLPPIEGAPSIEVTPKRYRPSKQAQRAADREATDRLLEGSPIIDGRSAMNLPTLQTMIDSAVKGAIGSIRQAIKEDFNEREVRINEAMNKFSALSDPSAYADQVFSRLAQLAASASQAPPDASGQPASVPPQMLAALSQIGDQIDARSQAMAQAGLEPSTRQLLFAALPAVPSLVAGLAMLQQGVASRQGNPSPSSPNSKGGGDWS